MAFAKFIAKIVDKITTLLSILLILVFLIYGGYSLWNSQMIMKGGFVSEKLLQYKPKESTDDQMSFSQMEEINQDISAWITIDDTNIDYPVVQGKDNLEYVNKDFYGEFSLTGVPFLDCRNHKDFSDNYNVLYAHHMDNGGMFGDLDKFLDLDYLNEHTNGLLQSKDHIYDIEFFSCFETFATDEITFGANNLNSIQYQQLLDYLCSNDENIESLNLTTEDKIIVLTTCSAENINGRIALFGILKERE